MREKKQELKRSELWNKLVEIVSQIPRQKVVCDAMDAPSCATEIEKLFPKWISVEDRLPEIEDDVLVYDPEFDACAVASYDGRVWYIFNPDWKEGDISHWKRLPEPPK